MEKKIKELEEKIKWLQSELQKLINAHTKDYKHEDLLHEQDNEINT